MPGGCSDRGFRRDGACRVLHSRMPQAVVRECRAVSQASDPEYLHFVPFLYNEAMNFERTCLRKIVRLALARIESCDVTHRFVAGI